MLRKKSNQLNDMSPNEVHRDFLKSFRTTNFAMMIFFHSFDGNSKFEINTKLILALHLQVSVTIIQMHRPNLNT